MISGTGNIDRVSFDSSKKCDYYSTCIIELVYTYTGSFTTTGTDFKGLTSLVTVLFNNHGTMLNTIVTEAKTNFHQ